MNVLASSPQIIPIKKEEYHTNSIDNTIESNVNGNANGIVHVNANGNGQHSTT
jgi:hypothetical protein